MRHKLKGKTTPHIEKKVKMRTKNANRIPGITGRIDGKKVVVFLCWLPLFLETLPFCGPQTETGGGGGGSC